MPWCAWPRELPRTRGYLHPSTNRLQQYDDDDDDDDGLLYVCLQFPRNGKSLKRWRNSTQCKQSWRGRGSTSAQKCFLLSRRQLCLQVAAGSRKAKPKSRSRFDLQHGAGASRHRSPEVPGDGSAERDACACRLPAHCLSALLKDASLFMSSYFLMCFLS